jgi:hypothetical protein
MDSMVFSTASVSGTFSSSTTFEAGDLLQRRRALRVRLVVAVVVARPDIDEADRGVGRARRAHAESGAECQRRAALQQMPS